MRRVKTSTFKVLVEGVILEPTKYSLYSKALFPKLDDGRNRVLKVGGGGFISG